MTDFEQAMMAVAQDLKTSQNRIEEKLDKVALDHEGRIATATANIASIQQDMHDDKVWSWVKFGGNALLSVASALGIKHLKI